MRFGIRDLRVGRRPTARSSNRMVQGPGKFGHHQFLMALSDLTGYVGDL